jgi:hypothetical protein
VAAASPAMIRFGSAWSTGAIPVTMQRHAWLESRKATDGRKIAASGSRTATANSLPWLLRGYVAFQKLKRQLVWNEG